MPDRAQAKQWLRESREDWDGWTKTPPNVFRFPGPAPGLRRYSYVRAVQRHEHRVEFTVLAVEGDRVVLRALIAADPTVLMLKDVYTSIGKDVALLWVERGGEIGAHDEGSPAITVEGIYAACEAALKSSADATPRMYFHPDGILMHCGYLGSECDECATVSVHSYSTYSVVVLEPLEPSCVLCRTRTGVAVPAARIDYESPEPARRGPWAGSRSATGSLGARRGAEMRQRLDGLPADVPSSMS